MGEIAVGLSEVMGGSMGGGRLCTYLETGNVLTVSLFPLAVGKPEAVGAARSLGQIRRYSGSACTAPSARSHKV